MMTNDYVRLARFVTFIFTVAVAIVLISVTLQNTVPGLIREGSVLDSAHQAEGIHGTSKDDADWPPLDSLIGDTKANITGDVQFILDFAIVGHAKCGTSFTMDWLSDHDEVAMYKHELRSLGKGRPAELVSQLYELPSGSNLTRGYKNPNDIKKRTALDAIHKYFPETKLIVGLRHPVSWFESYYNYRVRSKISMPPAETLIGKATKAMNGVATDEAKFHLHLDHLGKTNRSEEEQQLLSWGDAIRPKLPRMSNPVFVFELNQISDTNATRARLYRSDLKEFLGLKKDLDPIDTSHHKSKNFHYAIDICDEKYDDVRAALMENAVEASIWIRTYFLQSPEVTVSSPEYYNELLESWMVDPCTLQ